MNDFAASDTRFELFFDGDCPICRHEVALIRWLDRRRQVRLTDISDQQFDPARTGKTLPELMAEIHGRLPDGRVIAGVEVFRQLYSACGLGLIVGPTRLPGVSQLFDLGYRWFAANRLRLTGRCDTQCHASQAAP